MSNVVNMLNIGLPLMTFNVGQKFTLNGEKTIGKILDVESGANPLYLVEYTHKDGTSELVWNTGYELIEIFRQDSMRDYAMERSNIIWDISGNTFVRLDSVLGAYIKFPYPIDKLDKFEVLAFSQHEVDVILFRGTQEDCEAYIKKFANKFDNLD